jgi:hypothetical protein
MISEGSSKLIRDSEAEAHRYGSSRYLVLRRSSSARSNQPHAVRDTAMGAGIEVTSPYSHVFRSL